MRVKVKSKKEKDLCGKKGEGNEEELNHVPKKKKLQMQMK